MPEFYSKSFTFKTGITYAIGGGGTGYTSSYFPAGASAMEGVKALMVKGSGGATLNMMLVGTTHFVGGLQIASNTIYPFNPKMVSVRGPNDVFGFL